VVSVGLLSPRNIIVSRNAVDVTPSVPSSLATRQLMFMRISSK